jgi:endogenous inhibitor of DNA gyrase (YacG/DUF329 family)
MQEAPPAAQNASFPFCSPRCKVIDLGRWLGGGYRIPGETLEELAEGGVSVPPASESIH